MFRTAMTGIALCLCLVLPGCNPEPRNGPTLDQVNSRIQHQEPTAFPAAKSIADIERFGLKTPQGTVLDEAADSSTVTEHSFKRVYYVKLYVSSDVPTAMGFFMKSLKESRSTGGADAARVNGRTESGDDVEIMLGPAADHSKTVALAWVTQEK